MSTPYEAPSRPGQRHDSIGDAIPEPEPVQGAQDTYAKGELGSIRGLLSDITEDLSTLLRQEVALAKAEARESATKAGKGAGMLGAAGIAVHFLVLFLSLALWVGLGDVIDSLTWSAVIVAVLWGLVAAALALMGRNQIKAVKGLPQTQETAKRVPEALKGNEDHR